MPDRELRGRRGSRLSDRSYTRPSLSDSVPVAISVRATAAPSPLGPLSCGLNGSGLCHRANPLVAETSKIAREDYERKRCAHPPRTVPGEWAERTAVCTLTDTLLEAGSRWHSLYQRLVHCTLYAVGPT